MTGDELMKKCADLGLDKGRIQQVKEGLEFGLRADDVAIYAKPDFDVHQMNIIRLAIKNRLLREELEFVANDKFNGHQMEQIVMGLKEGLTLEKVKEYADEGITAHEMCKKRMKFIRDKTIEAPNMFDKSYYDEMLRLADKQSKQMEMMNQQFQEVQEFLKKRKEATVTDQGNNQEQMIENLINEIKHLNALLQEKDNCIDALKSGKFTNERSRIGLASFFSCTKPKKVISVIELMTDSRFSEEQLEQIRLGYEHGLSAEDIAWYAKYKFSASRMKCMRSVIESGRKRKE